MKKLITLLFAFAMILSSVFISGAISSDSSLSAQAQTVRVKRVSRGVASRTYRGGRYVVRKTWNGTRYVSRKVWVATKWTGKKSYKTGRKVVSRTKKILN
ncbi:MAG: hypothetical protein H7070_03385 [Saprospiraceae bacterium]|nr:hypothetical protein [Pyrinomonadaceae bacterium]